MKIYFNKYHGTGNDFIIIDNRNGVFDPDNQALIEDLCKRHLGIGADGLMLLNKSKELDFEMIYFNSDGKEGTMCGNGGRCMVAFARKLGIIDSYARFQTIDGVHTANITNDLVSLSMADVRPPSVRDGKHFIDTGSPHLIIPTQNLPEVNVLEAGRTYRYSELFAPNGTNVNFVEKKEEGIHVRTYERGVEAETLSCGTGVTAAAISSKWDSGPGEYSVVVTTQGGKLTVSFTITDKLIKSVWLKGPAKFVFEGEIDV